MTIIAKNQTAGALAISQLPIPDQEIPASGQVTLTDYANISEIQNDDELKSHITAGDVILNDGASDFTLAESLELVSGTPLAEMAAAKGDLFIATAPATVERLAVGSDNDILIAASTEAAGIKWGSAPAAVFVDYYNSAAYTGITTSASTLPLNTERQSDPAFTLSANEITVNAAGTYRIDFDLSLDESSTSDTTVDMWLEVNGGEVGGTRARMFHDNNMEEGGNHSMCILTVADADVLRVRAQVVSGSSQTDTLANGTRVVIHTVGADGATGPQGPPGAGSTIIVEDEGATVTGGPHSTLDFVGDGVTATDAGGGVCTVTIPGGSANIAQYRQDNNLTINTSATTVALNSTDFEDSAYSRAGSDITINRIGIYRISYSVYFDTDANARRTVDAWVENNTVEIVPSRSASYTRNNTDDTANSTATFFVELAAADVVRLRAQSTGTSGTAIGQGDRMWICLEFLRAP